MRRRIMRKLKRGAIAAPRSVYREKLDRFTTQFAGFLGIDLYQHPFDREQGYAIYQFDVVEILCLKLEKFPEVSAKALEELVGVPVSLPRFNCTTNKAGGSKYAYLRKALKFPAEDFRRLYASEYVRHYYLEREIVSFLNEWSATDPEYLPLTPQEIQAPL